MFFLFFTILSFAFSFFFSCSFFLSLSVSLSLSRSLYLSICSEEAESRPVAPWNETPEELEKRLQQAVARINKDFNVRGLCMEFPDRLHDLANKTYGDRLPK